jgi:hypothetical protein
MDATYARLYVPRWSLLCNYCNYSTHSPYISLSFMGSDCLRIHFISARNEKSRFRCCTFSAVYGHPGFKYGPIPSHLSVFDFIPYTQMPEQQFSQTKSPDCFFTYTFNALFTNSFSFCVVQAYNLI